MAASAASGLRGTDMQRALRFLRGQRVEAPSLQGFAQSANAGLADLIGADIVTLSSCDLRAGTRSVVTWPEHALGTEDVGCFNRFFHAHPLVRFHSTHPDGGAHRISDSVPDASFRRSALYAEYYRRIGIAHVVAVPVYVDADRLVSFVLNRAGREFSDRDCAVLDALSFQLGAEYMAQEIRLRAQRTQAQLNALLLAAGLAVIVLDRSGRVLRSSASALRWLSYAGLGRAVRVGERLPEPIDRWLRARIEPSWAMFDAGPLAMTTPAHTLRLHLLQGEDALTLMIERTDPPPTPALAADCGLTAREREILRWLAAGKSNADIAAILRISPRTVQKHLERMFRKLGVENRTAAVMRALRADREE
jgi:DNA-binding CsgD family transcriptional regulator/PAS domain-containing protein